jgi:ribonucleoside-diphosphate reductase alpha chain
MPETTEIISETPVEKIKKRDGRVVAFDRNKILMAVYKASQVSRPNNRQVAEKISKMVIDRLQKTRDVTEITSVDIEKCTKDILIEEGHHSTAENFTYDQDLDEQTLSKAVYAVAKKYRAENREMAERIADYVVDLTNKRFNGHTIPTVEEIQDIIEKTLIENSHAKTAKCYILYRQKRGEIRKAKAALGVEDNLKLSLNSLSLLAGRYLIKDRNSKIIETPEGMFRRVAKAIALCDRLYDSNADIEKIEEEFYQMMVNLEFIPNAPTLYNAGTDIGQLSGCFVLPVEDSIEGIYEALKYQAIVQKSGGGTGFSFSRIRPKGDVVRSTGGVASGPVSFMRIFDSSTNEVKQGGKRRGANMGILRIDHPDIMDFVVCKEREGILSNFNISVAITDKFMKALLNNEEYDLINPKNGMVLNKMNARAIWNLIAAMAWKTGDPGIIFIDRINNSFSNPVAYLGPVESTNPCGEQPLYPYDSCNLGSINLVKMLKEVDGVTTIDWEKLRETVRKSVHFLDNVIDANKYPIIEIELMTRKVRRTGLGVMGFADMLILLGVPYNSENALRIAESIMKFITEEARNASVELAQKRGSFPEFENSVWKKLGYPCMRNSTLTTIAPTGEISIISGCSMGIEPLFSIVYMRTSESLATTMIEINPLFERIAIREGFYSEDLIEKISKSTSIQHVQEIPENIRKLFVTAHDISPDWHIRMQAVFQKYTDNAVSKTINFPNIATPRHVEESYLLAYRMGCKGMTIFRDGSKSAQVLTTVKRAEEQAIEPAIFIDPLVVPETYNGGCTHCSL